MLTAEKRMLINMKINVCIQKLNIFLIIDHSKTQIFRIINIKKIFTEKCIYIFIADHSKTA